MVLPIWLFTKSKMLHDATNNFAKATTDFVQEIFK